jgi:hypothetical protein
MPIAFQKRRASPTTRHREARAVIGMFVNRFGMLSLRASSAS